MSILLIEHRGKRRGGEIAGRVLIGRWPQNTVVLEDRTVSRIHAWIAPRDDGHYIVDATSRTGTFVNGESITDRRQLRDGDEIRIGVFALRYQVDSTLPQGVEEIKLISRPGHELRDEKGGNFVDCACGAPIWLPPHYVGMGRCRYCGRSINGPAPAPMAMSRRRPVATPKPPPVAPPPPPTSLPAEDIFDAAMDGQMDLAVSDESAPQTSTAIYVPATRPPPRPAPKVAREIEPDVAEEQEERTCGVCHAAIAVFDEIAQCPSCGLSFHGDCWRENHGCSSYGCDQVGVLDAGPPGQ
ncbi:MAG TPA: FHA domain-containing protein [Tepidisphaeraceae bacterium]|jgi:ribosomal protein L37AE/L43A|nr:FHA domain-containing protein [Tepidisphaeraceae bacterium]